MFLRPNIALIGLALALSCVASALGQCPNGRCPLPSAPPATVYFRPAPRPAPAYAYAYAHSTTTTATAVAPGLAEVNAYRARHGLPPLAYDPSCDSAAATNNACQRARGLGHYVGGTQCAAVGSASAAHAVAQWIASAPHRAILLSRSITRGAVRCEGGCATFQAR